jgi:oligoribonuclease
MSSDRLAWADLETTGLEVDRELILEVAFLVTEADLTPVDDGYTAVIHCDRWRLEMMTPQVREMHTRSGLVEESIASTVTLEEAAAGALAYLTSHVPPRAVPCAGSTIRFDRKFLEARAPAIENYLHHRTVDVSTVKELVRRWFPRTYLRLPQHASQHRAMPDIQASIAELAWYRAEAFTSATTAA